MRKIVLFVLVMVIMSSYCAVGLAADKVEGNDIASDIEEAKAEEIQDIDLNIITKSEYDKMDEKQKDAYLTRYCAAIEDSINNQLKEIHESFINKLNNQKEFEEAAELADFSKDYKVILDLNDKKIRSKLEQSLAEPVVFKNITPIAYSSKGIYLEETSEGYFAYMGRTVTHSLYSKVYSTSGTYNGEDIKTYDVSQYIYSWSGNSTYQDRVDYAWSGVVQYDARTFYIGNYTYDTGWPEHYYSGSFEKNESTINLSPGCEYSNMGGASAGVHAKAVFSNGSAVRYDDLDISWGKVVWIY